MRIVPQGLMVASVLTLAACGGGRQMHERPAKSVSKGSVTESSVTGTSPASPSRTVASPVTAPIVPTETESTTPTAYAAVTPQKPKLTGISQDELTRCEEKLPTLDSCKPSKSLAEGQSNVVDQVRICVAHYVAALDDCLCKAGSKPHCQYAEDQKRQISKMGP